MRRLGLPLFAIVLLAWTAAAARADAIVLEDGRALDGVVVEVRGDTYIVKLTHGALVLPRDSVHAHFVADDPDGARTIESIRRRRHWRSRHRYTSPCFRYETTVPEFIFARYREAMDRHCRALQREFGLEDEEGEGPTVCLYASADMFMRVGGVSGGAQGYFRRFEPMELAFYDDRQQRDVSVRVGRWLAAGYVLHRAFPELGLKTFLCAALADYYGASVEDPDRPGGLRALVSGTHWESLHEDRRRDASVDLTRLTKGHAQYRLAWGWALVHFLLGSDAYAETFRRFLPSAAGTSTEADLEALEKTLGLDDAEARRRFLDAWKAHLDALKPATRVDWILAGEVAAHLGHEYRAAAHYREAGGRPHGALREARWQAEQARLLREGDSRELDALSHLLDLEPLDLEARRRRVEVLRAMGGGTSVARETALGEEIAKALGESWEEP